MSQIVYEHVNAYLRSLVNEQDAYFLGLEAYAEEHHVPIIHSEVKNLLAFIVESIKANSVLELGTAIGYSASVFAKAMKGEGKIVSVERRQDYYEMACENVKELNYNTKFDFRFGEATEVLESVDETFDIIFLDAAKGHYREFFDLCFHKLNPGGVIISDNILYKGMIASDALVLRRQKTIVKRMRAYLDFISNHPQLTTTILPMSDGIALSYKREA